MARFSFDLKKMQENSPIVSVVYHSNYGHTKVVAQCIADGIKEVFEEVHLISVLEAEESLEILHLSDAIIFGSPTYFGGVSAEFKRFMEFTGSFWYRQMWKDKFAAGFTNSSTLNGDKLNTLIQLSVFAAQHSMLWIPLGIMPKFNQDQQESAPNMLASYLGLMTLSDNSLNSTRLPADLVTATAFGVRIASLIQQYQSKRAGVVETPR